MFYRIPNDLLPPQAVGESIRWETPRHTIDAFVATTYILTSQQVFLAQQIFAGRSFLKFQLYNVV